MLAGSVLSGLAAYGVIALGTRAVGEVAFAPVSVLWSLWALSAAAISFPVQHWTIRSAELGGEGAVRSRLPGLTVSVLVAGALAFVVALSLGTRLYPSSPVAFASMTAFLPIGGLAVGVQRGLLAHREAFEQVATSLAGENLVRVLVAAAVLAAGVDAATGAVALGWGIVAGFLVALARPSVLRGAGDTADTAPASMSLLGGFAGANVAAQAALTSGPVVLALFAAPEDVITQVFAVLALLRVPYTGAVGASAAATGPLARVVDGGRGAELRRWELRGVVALALVAGLAYPLAPLVLPPVVDVLFATSVGIPVAAQGMLAAGGVLALGGLAEMLVLLAFHRPRRLLGAWAIALMAGGGALLLPLTPVTRVALAFLIAEAVSLLALAARRPADAVT